MMAVSLRDPNFPLTGSVDGLVDTSVRPSGVLAVCCHMRWTTFIPG
jgi:hypothetical protein